MFNRFLSPKVGLVLITFLASVAFVNGQDGPPPNPGPGDMRPRDGRQNMMAELGLSQEQIQQFRSLGATHRPLMNAAQQRLRDANRELDMAIYADTVSDEIVRAKLKAFQDAQAEVNRLRFTNELDIRKILTQEQLVRFREMRRRFAEMRDGQIRGNGRPGDRMQRRDGPPNQRQPDGNQLTRPAGKQTKPNN